MSVFPPVTRKTRAQFPAAEITAARGDEHGDDAVARDSCAHVMSCVAPLFKPEWVSVEAAGEDNRGDKALAELRAR